VRVCLFVCCLLCVGFCVFRRQAAGRQGRAPAPKPPSPRAAHLRHQEGRVLVKDEVGAGLGLGELGGEGGWMGGYGVRWVEQAEGPGEVLRPPMCAQRPNGPAASAPLRSREAAAPARPVAHQPATRGKGSWAIVRGPARRPGGRPQGDGRTAGTRRAGPRGDRSRSASTWLQQTVERSPEQQGRQEGGARLELHDAPDKRHRPPGPRRHRHELRGGADGEGRGFAREDFGRPRSPGWGPRGSPSPGPRRANGARSPQTVVQWQGATPSRRRGVNKNRGPPPL
jgi:hypothetical protein